MKPSEYITRKEILLYTPGVIRNGVLYAIHEGKEIPDKEFREIFKLPDRLYSVPENPNKKVGSLI